MRWLIAGLFFASAENMRVSSSMRRSVVNPEVSG